MLWFIIINIQYIIFQYYFGTILMNRFTDSMRQCILHKILCQYIGVDKSFSKIFRINCENDTKNLTDPFEFHELEYQNFRYRVSDTGNPRECIHLAIEIFSLSHLIFLWKYISYPQVHPTHNTACKNWFTLVTWKKPDQTIFHHLLTLLSVQKNKYKI